jgi:GntR family transcriptional repressor for pyruvate dehydrogenase complex
MDENPVLRGSTISDTVYARMVEEILTGRWPAGDAVASERDLAQSWQVNRNAVREALKRVQQAGLVRISHGGKTRVLDWRTNAGLDVLSTLALAGTVPAGKVAIDIAVMRRAIGTDAAGLCAAHATDEQRAAVCAAAAAFPEAAELDVLGGFDLVFWCAVIDGSNNLAYRLALNTLLAAIDEVGAAAYNMLNAAELTDRQAKLELAAAIDARDADTASRIAGALLSRLVIACRSLERSIAAQASPDTNLVGQPA